MARIVLIEDSPTDRAVFTQWLRRAGHEVLEADNAEDGLQLVPRPGAATGADGRGPARHERLPGHRAMARDAAIKHIPVIIVSTKAMETDKAWGLRQGAADYIVKPPREDELIARINELVA